MSNTQILEDSELVKEILTGKLELFEEILNRYERQILVYTKRLLNGNQHDSEDATSETFFKCYKNIASYNESYKFSSWLYRIAHNTAVNIIRSKSNLFFFDTDSFWQIPNPTKDESPITKDELEKVLDSLKFEEKNILILFYLNEKSLREIGDILKITDNSVAQKLSRARKKAKEIITKQFAL